MVICVLCFCLYVCITKSSQNLVPSCCLETGHVKILSASLQSCWWCSYFWICSPPLLTVFHLWIRAYIPLPSESCSPSPLPCNHWCVAYEFVVTGKMFSLQMSFFKRATGDDNLMVWGQECWVDMATLPIQNLWWPSVAIEELLFRHLSFGTNSIETSIQTP